MPKLLSRRKVPVHLLYFRESSNNDSEDVDRALVTNDHDDIDKSAARLMSHHPQNQNNTAPPSRASVAPAPAPASHSTGTQTEPEPEPDDGNDALKQQIQHLEAALGSQQAQHTTAIAALRESAAADLAQQRATIEELTRDRRRAMHQYARLRTNMQVMVRVRPALAREAGMETARIWRDGADGRVRVRWPEDRAAGKNSNSRRTPLLPGPVVDHLFPPDAPNEAVFAEVEDLLYMAVDGAADVCVLVYGPTGSGKSYTMGHIVEAAARKIFRRAGHPHRHQQRDGSASGDDDDRRGGSREEGEEGEGVRVTARYIECYQEALYDLFSAYTPGEEEGTGRRGAGPTKRKPEKEKKLELRHDEARQRTEVTQAVTPVFRDAAALLRGLAEADGRRKTAATKLNARSSRSHAILTLYLDRRRDEHGDDGGENAREARVAAPSRGGSTRLKPGFRAGEEEEGDLGMAMTGKSITLVDLAGSEPLNQHDDDDDSKQRGESTAQARREETKKINLSLHELRNVISQLSAPLAQPPPRPPPSRSLSPGDKEQHHPNPNPNPGANNPQTNTKKTKTTTTTATKKEGKAFVPYNNSKLTRLLKYSLGFGARTLFLVCVSPLAAHAARTEASLEFAACVSLFVFI